MLSNMACSLIEHKRINTTVAKAKALRVYIEPIITRSKDDSTHSRRMVFRLLKSKLATAELFRDIAPAVADRPGGYTRIIRTEYRLGDNAEMCLMELVDFNELLKNDKGSAKKGRSRRSSKPSAKATTTETPAKKEKTEAKAVAEAVVAPEVEAVVAPEVEVAEIETPTVETPEAKKEETPEKEAPKEEDQDKKES